jgi:Putative type VII ESX secretion system translocon, EccE
VQILESSFPDPGHGVREWFTGHGIHDETWASSQYAALMDNAAPASCTHRTLISLSLDLRRVGRAIRDAGGGMAGAAEVLRGDMVNCANSLRAADLRTEGWLSPTDLAVAVRQAYDPAVTESASVDTILATAGPVAVDEHWDYLQHDSGFSAVLWISEWPRIDVAPHFLHALVFLQDVRKSISIVAKPLGTSEALRAIRKEKVEYLTEAQQNARIGKIADLSADQEYADVLARERALVSGHVDIRFSGFIAITAKTRDQLSAAVAATERAATQCGCETRLLFGQQAQAFMVAALPLGRAVH